MTVEGVVLDAPSRRDEAWKYTPVDEIVARLGTAVAPDAAAARAVDSAALDAVAGSHGGPRLVLVDGRYSADLSSGLDDHVRATHERLAAEAPVDGTTDGFVAFNQAADHDVATVSIEAGTDPGDPIHVVHLSTGAGDDAPVLSQPRTVVRVGAAATATLIETYVGLGAASFVNASTEVEVGEGATLDYYRVQRETTASTHVGSTRLEVAERGDVRVTAVTCGGDIARNAMTVCLRGPDARADLGGLAVSSGSQRHDTVVTVDHVASRCASNQHFAGIAGERGRGSFGGEIIVRPGTVGTDAHQSSRNLVLSKTAEADTRPWLQIFADDVRCTHGATVGRLDDAALFYLRSRGIPDALARRMLIEAFAREVTDRIAVPTLRDDVTALIAAAHPVRSVSDDAGHVGGSPSTLPRAKHSDVDETETEEAQ